MKQTTLQTLKPNNIKTLNTLANNAKNVKFRERFPQAILKH